MPEPISEVPNTRVRIISLSKTASVKIKAVPTETAIEASENKIGTGVLKTKISIIKTARKETIEIKVISLDAFDELSLE